MCHSCLALQYSTPTALADLANRLLHSLDEPLLRRIVDQQLKGWPNREIALQCGLAVRTIERKLLHATRA